MIPLKGILSKPDEKYKNTVAAIKLFSALDENPNIVKTEEKKQKVALTVLDKILLDDNYSVEELNEEEE